MASDLNTEVENRISSDENIQNQIDVIESGQLGPIKPTDAAPTPERNGTYTFSIGGTKPSWLTAEPLITEVKAGDGVAVVYAEPSYTYTHLDTGLVIAQELSESTVKVPSSKVHYDGLVSLSSNISEKQIDFSNEAPGQNRALTTSFNATSAVTYGVLKKYYVEVGKKYKVRGWVGINNIGLYGFYSTLTSDSYLSGGVAKTVAGVLYVEADLIVPKGCLCIILTSDSNYGIDLYEYNSEKIVDLYNKISGVEDKIRNLQIPFLDEPSTINHSLSTSFITTTSTIGGSLRKYDITAGRRYRIKGKTLFNNIGLYGFYSETSIATYISGGAAKTEAGIGIIDITVIAPIGATVLVISNNSTYGIEVYKYDSDCISDLSIEHGTLISDLETQIKPAVVNYNYPPSPNTGISNNFNGTVVVGGAIIKKYLVTAGRTYRLIGKIGINNIGLYGFYNGTVSGSYISGGVAKTVAGVLDVDVSLLVPDGITSIMVTGDTTHALDLYEYQLASLDGRITTLKNTTDSLVSAKNNNQSWQNFNNSILDKKVLRRYANTLKCTSEFNNYLTDLVQEGDLMVHTSAFDIDSGNVYCVYMVNKSAAIEASDQPIFVRLHVFNIATPATIDTYEVCKIGSVYDGYAISGATFDPSIIIVGGVCHIQFTTQVNSTGTWIMAKRDFVISTGSFNAFTPLNFVYGSTTYAFDNVNVNANLSKKQYFVALSGYQTMQPNFSVRNEGGIDYYYVGCASTSGFSGMILKTADFVNWIFVAVPNIQIDGNYEPACYVLGNYAFMAFRQATEEKTQVLARYNIMNDTWEQYTHINDCQSRSVFFYIGGELFLVHAPVDRTSISFIKLNLDDLELSEAIQSKSDSGSIFYPFTKEYNGHLYCTYTIDRLHIKFIEFSLNSISQETVDNAFKALFGL